MKKVVPLSAGVITLVVLWSQLFEITPGRNGISDAELACVWGAQSGDAEGCATWFEDAEMPCWDCWSPYAHDIDNDCDWKKCGTGIGDNACGEGTQWSNLNMPSWFQTGDVGDLAFRGKSSPCTGIIDCSEGPRKPDHSCDASILVSHFLDMVPRVQGRGCYQPLASEPPPTGCRSCAAGTPKPYHANNANGTWYEHYDCPNSL